MSKVKEGRGGSSLLPEGSFCGFILVSTQSKVEPSDVCGPVFEKERF